MADFKTTLAKQKIYQTINHSSPAVQRAQQQPALQPSTPAETPPPPPIEAFAGRPTETQDQIVLRSNRLIGDGQLHHEKVSSETYTRMCTQSYQLFSDGIFRRVSANNGIITYVPMLICSPH